MWSPQFECVVGEGGEASNRVGHELIDELLEFIEARARPNTVKAYAHDLKVFFTVVAKAPAEVTSHDVVAFVTDQRRSRVGAENVVRNGPKVVPLVRGVRRLPRILAPAEVNALMGALRTDRDRAIVQAMLPAGLRRCEVLGLRLEDLRLGEWKVFVADGKGGHERVVPMSTTFFTTVAAYLNTERPAEGANPWRFVVRVRP